MSSRTPIQLVLDVLAAVEKRDLARVVELYHPEIEFRWPPGLPYGGEHRGPGALRMNARFAAIWDPLQPTDHERRLDPVVVAATGNDVIVRYIWRGRRRDGRSCAIETLAHYRVDDDRLRFAQMYHFDLGGLLAFLVE